MENLTFAIIYLTCSGLAWRWLHTRGLDNQIKTLLYSVVIWGLAGTVASLHYLIT